MSKKVISILIAVIMSFSAMCGVMAHGLPDKPDVTSFAYTLTNKDGEADTAITSGGTLEVNMTLENNTGKDQPYLVILQILNKGSKVAVYPDKGTLIDGDDASISLSHIFSETETDFSGYGAEVYVWSDMTSMQPISTHSVFGSDDNRIYAYNIDGDLLYTKGNDYNSYYLAKNYVGIPKVTPIFHNLGSTFTLTPALGEVTTEGQDYIYNVTSLKGSIKEHTLNLYRLTDETDPKNADLKSVTMPVGSYSNNYKVTGDLYPSFNSEVTQYTVFTNLKAYAGVEPVFETVNPAASVSLTTAPDTSLDSSTAVYTVTSADGTVTKEYSFNYRTDAGTKLGISYVRNGYYGTGTCFYSWFRGSKELIIDDNDANKATFNNGAMEPIVIQDGTFSRAIKDTRPIIEIDISTGPESIKYGVLMLTKTKNINAANTAGTLRLYKINDTVYDTTLADIAQTDTASYYGDELTSITVDTEIGTRGMMYFINIDAAYYNSLKAAGKTKMYIGLAGEADDAAKALGAVFGAVASGDASFATSGFRCIEE